MLFDCRDYMYQKQYHSLLRHEHGAFGHSVREIPNNSDTQYRPLRREHADAARAGQSMNGFI